MRVAGKVWGETSLIHANGVLEFHRIAITNGGHCSKHKHDYKWNGFYVESGCLVVKVWQKDYDLVDETHMYRGDFVQVKPGLYHSFEAKENTVAFELYWAEFNHDDIVRETVGGALEPEVKSEIEKFIGGGQLFDEKKSDLSKLRSDFAKANGMYSGPDSSTTFSDGSIYNADGEMIRSPDEH